MKQKQLYTPLTQKPYCCVPACICMILNRRKIEHNTQEQIGYELGLIVPKNKARLFSKVRSGKKPVSGYGTQVGKKKYSINNFFLKNNINLKEVYCTLKNVNDAKVVLSDNLKKNNDIIVCFNNKKLYGKGNYGHVSLIQSLNNNTVTLVDPENRVPKIRKVNLAKLIDGVKKHGRSKRSGFWVISG